MQREYQPKWLKMFRKISRAKLRRKKKGARILHVTSTDIVGVEISITQVFFFCLQFSRKRRLALERLERDGATLS